MSEMDQESPDEQLAEQATGQVTGQTTGQATGHPAVDEVLESLSRLDGQPVDGHVAVFEQAHETLRRALSEARDHEA